MGAEKALIFGSLACERWDFLRPLLNWPDVVVAADGGQDTAQSAGFAPSVYIGDGDSGGRPAPGQTCVTLPAEKDVTDLEAAYAWALEHGARELIFTGCTGGRLDHHMAAMSLLETAAGAGLRAVILDPRNRVEFLLPGDHVVEERGYRYFSLLPADALLEGVSIQNAKYELENRDVSRGSSLTVSNELVKGPARISIRRGSCWLIQSK